MAIFVTCLSLELPGRTFEIFYVFGVTTLWTFIFSLMCLAWIKFLLRWYIMVVLTWVPLVTVFFFWMPHKVNLSCLGINCNLFEVSSSRLWRLHLFGRLPHLACWKLFQIYIWNIYGFGNKLIILQEIPECISVQDASCFWWVLGKRHLSLNSIVPLMNWSIALSEACQQVISGSNFICL